MNYTLVDDPWETPEAFEPVRKALVKVRYIGASDDQVRWGSNDDPRGLLTEGNIYTVQKIRVHTWHTKYWLWEHPNNKFNSASFDVLED